MVSMEKGKETTQIPQVALSTEQESNLDTSSNEEDIEEPQSDDSSDDESSSSGNSDSDESMEDVEQKDTAERELEKLVFGDAAGFRSALQDFPVPVLDTSAQESTSEKLNLVHDAGLLPLIEEGADESLRRQYLQDVEATQHDELEQALRRQRPPAWEDSDDERLHVSLMSVPRLRKLRNYEGEDVISGKEYQRRLRRQYELLHPPPKWAQWQPKASATRQKKRRKVSHEDTENDSVLEDENTDSDVSITSDHTHAPPPSLTNLLKSTRPLVRQIPAKLSIHSPIPLLKPEVLDIDRLPDIVPPSSAQPHATTSLSLHPTLPLLISAGISGMLYMHHVLPFPTPPNPPNPVITSLHMKNTPFTSSIFSPLNGGEKEPRIYMACGRRSFHTWTLPTGVITKTTTTNMMASERESSQRHVSTLRPSPCGRWLGVLGTGKKGGGVVNILSATTLQWVAQARGEGRGGLADFGWWSDGEGLCLVGKSGDVSEWSVEERKVVFRWRDEGGVGVIVMAMGPNVDANDARKSKKKKKKGGVNAVIGPDRWTVLGTNSGFVSVYDRGTFKIDGAGKDNAPRNNVQSTNGATTNDVTAPKPHATLSHLTTAITYLSISACGQLLAIASKWKRDALRLVHLPTGKVYQNWPTSRTPIGRISSLLLGENEGVTRGVNDDEGRGIVLVVGNEQGVVRNWVVRG